MLKVSLHNFRCWSNLELDIPWGRITLIKGSSGAGKSTIFQALFWCLYGTVKSVSPNNTDDTKIRTRVKLSFPYRFKGRTDTLTIERQKNPGRFLVTYNGATREDAVAQSLIVECFGGHELWVASCYINQGTRNTFITAPNAGKMELLNLIAFNEEDPAKFIEQIDKRIALVDATYKSMLKNYETKVSTFTTKCTQYDFTTMLTQLQVEALRNTVVQLQEQQRILLEDKTRREVYLKLQGEVTMKLQRTQSELAALVAPISPLSVLNGASSIETYLTSIAGTDELIRKRVQLDNELHTTRRNLSTLTPVEVSGDLEATKAREILYHNSRNTVVNLGVTYDAVSIATAVTQYQAILDAQDVSQKIMRVQTTLTKSEQGLQQYRSQWDSVSALMEVKDIIPNEIAVPDYSSCDLADLEATLLQLKDDNIAIMKTHEQLSRTRDILNCPACQHPLRIQVDNTLIMADEHRADEAQLQDLLTESTSKKSEMSKVSIEIARRNDFRRQLQSQYETATRNEQTRIMALQNHNRAAELHNQRCTLNRQTIQENIDRNTVEVEALRRELNDLPSYCGIKILSETERTQVQNLVAYLRQVTVLSLPEPSSALISQSLQYKDALHKCTLAESAYKDFNTCYNDPMILWGVEQYNNHVAAVRKYGSDVRQYEERLVNLSTLITQYEEELKDIQGKIPAEGDLGAILLSISSHNGKLEKDRQMKVLVSEQQSLESERNEVVKVNDELATLYLLRQHAVEEECTVLENIVSSINTAMDDICGIIYDDDINILLSLHKTVKSTKNSKPCVNFSVSYKGGAYDNINQLSGGEGDRASLALTLALHRLSGCPILLLDESLAALDCNTKETVMQAIREYQGGTVLIVMHSGVEGIFDETIDVDELACCGK